eukprot:m.288283 g.288283  ORF g.288283 m.288283 type:complete len:269 (+) comp40706_c0_seq45:1101-1907(+)
MPLYPFCFQIFFSHVEEPTILRKKLEETTEQERRCVLPTRVSCHATSLEIAKVLDEFGIDVAAPCNEIGGVAPLLSAAFDGKIDYVNFLLEKKADMNITDNDGCSALHHAVEGNQEDMLRHLIEKGCDKTIKNKYGETAYDVAEQKGNTNLSGLLKTSDDGKDDKERPQFDELDSSHLRAYRDLVCIADDAIEEHPAPGHFELGEGKRFKSDTKMRKWLGSPVAVKTFQSEVSPENIKPVFLKYLHTFSFVIPTSFLCTGSSFGITSL